MYVKAYANLLFWYLSVIAFCCTLFGTCNDDSSGMCDPDTMYKIADQIQLAEERSTFMDQYMKSCSVNSLSDISLEPYNKSAYSLAKVRMNNLGCLPSTGSLTPIGFRGELKVNGYINAILYVSGQFLYVRNGANQCKATLTLINFEINRMILSSKFAKICVEITDNTTTSCSGCSFNITRIIEDEEYSSTTSTLPPPQMCPGSIDIIQLLEISANVTNDELSQGLKPGAKRVIDSFDLGSDAANQTSTGLQRFNNSSTTIFNLGSDVGQSAVGSKAIIDLINNSGGSPKIEKGLAAAYEEFSLNARENSTKVLVVFAKSLPFDLTEYQSQVDNLLSLENFLPLIIAFDTSPNSQEVKKLKKLAGCDANDFCKNLVQVSPNDFEGIITAADFLSRLACKVISKRSSSKPNIYPALKMKVDDIKMADIQNVTGVNTFLQHVKAQSADAIGISNQSLVPYKIAPAVDLVSSKKATGFLTSKLSGLTAGLTSSLSAHGSGIVTRSSDTIAAASNVLTGAESLSEGTIVEFLIIDEFDAVASILKKGLRASAFPRVEKLDAFLQEKLSFLDFGVRSGMLVSQAVREAKLKFLNIKDGFAATLSQIGKNSLQNEDPLDSSRRYNAISLIKNKKLLQEAIANAQSKSVPLEPDVVRAYESLSCILNSDATSCTPFMRGSAIPTNINSKIFSALTSVQRVFKDKLQLEYITRKAEPLKYLLSIKEGTSRYTPSTTETIKQYTPSFEIIEKALH